MSAFKIKASFKRYLFISVAAATLAAAPVTAHAQYRELKAEKPNVEVDMDALARQKPAAPASPLQGSRPAWQKPREPDAPHTQTAPVILRRPAPLAEPMPSLAPARQAAPAANPSAREDVPETVVESIPAVPVPSAAAPAADEPAAKPAARVLKPLFAAPVVPPADMKPAVQQAAPTPAAPAHAVNDTPRTASQATEDVPPPALVRPVRDIMPETAQPAAQAKRINMPISQKAHPALQNAAEQPAKAAAPRQPLSYPPSEAPRSAGQVFERPVLPSGLRRDEVSPVIPRRAETSVKPAEENTAAPDVAAQDVVTSVKTAAPAAAPVAANIAEAATPETAAVDPVLAPIVETAKTAPAETAPIKTVPAKTADVKTPDPESLPARKPAQAAITANSDAPIDAPAAVQTPVKKPAVKATAVETPAAKTPAPRPSLVIVEDIKPKIIKDTETASESAAVKTEKMPAAPVAAVSAAPVTAPPAETPRINTVETPRPASHTAETQAATNKAAEEIAAPVITTLPVAKPTENIPPPLTEPQLVQIGKNIETIPARVAVAPPRLEPQDIDVPTLADLTLEFDGASSDLNAPTRQKLVNIIPHLKQQGERRLAVHAYASGEDGSKSSARRISLSRALAVRAFLMDNGVQPTRVDVRALGLETDRKPLERVDLVFAR